jgi:hypothetical protein
MTVITLSAIVLSVNIMLIVNILSANMMRVIMLVSLW